MEETKDDQAATGRASATTDCSVADDRYEYDPFDELFVAAMRWKPFMDGQEITKRVVDESKVQTAADQCGERIDGCVKEIDHRLTGLRLMLRGLEGIQETSQEDYYGTTRDGDRARQNLRTEIASLERYRSAILLTKREL